MQYITDLKIISGKDAKAPDGYVKDSRDLNEKAGGSYLYLCYKKEEVAVNAGNVVTDIQIVSGKGAQAPSGYTKLDTDLNQKAGGDYLYLCFKKERLTSAEKGITNVCIIEGKNAEPPKGYKKLFTDLNRNAGGKYLYLCFENGARDLSDDRQYELKIHTGDIYLGGTDANIFISFLGAFGSSRMYRLNGLISGNAFERNDTDVVLLTIDEKYEDIGPVYGIKVKSDMKYAGAGWYCDKITVRSQGGSISEFLVDQWIEDTDDHIFYDPKMIKDYKKTAKEINIFSDATYYVPANTKINVKDTSAYKVGFKLAETKVSEISTTTSINTGIGFSKKPGADLALSSINAAFSFVLATKEGTTDQSEITSQVDRTVEQSIEFPVCEEAKEYRAVYIEKMEDYTFRLGNLEMTVPRTLSQRAAGFQEVSKRS